ncbi:MAG: insulinase family protein [Victivallales bacterium]|jgi:zinc protease|nr:insulinase family protein [Victivallales bacterium]
MKFYQLVSSRTFANGVRVFVLPQPGTAVEVECFIRTGSIHEGKYLGCGLSHFLEHMLFQGCKEYPGTSAADAIDRLGGAMNAYTSYDHTAIHANLSGRHLPEAIKILSHMVRFPSFPESRFPEEKEVILREEEMGRDNPDRQLIDHLNCTIYANHPLRHPIIGYRELIAEVTREMMIDYYSLRYTPGRCFWVIVGDVNTEEAFDLVDREMSDWQRRHLEEPAILPEATQCAKRFDEFSFADPLARIALGVRIPEITHPDTVGCDVLSGILGMGDGSRLVRLLELEKALAVNLRSCSHSHASGGVLAISAQVTPQKLQKFESALLRELDSIRNGGITRAEVEREKTQQYAEHLRELRSIRDIAANIGGGVIANGVPDLGDSYLERLMKLSLNDINRIAANYLNAEHFSLVRQYSKQTKLKNSQVNEKFKPDLQLSTLDNGARLVTLPDHRLPLIDFALTLPGGTIFEDKNFAGISALLADLLNAGAGRWTESELLTRLDDAGANFAIHAGLNSFTIECTFPRRFHAKVVELLKAIIATPTLGKSEFEREKANRLEMLKSRELAPRPVAIDRCRQLLFGDHPYSWGINGSPGQLVNITRDKLAEFYFSRLVPTQAIFGWSGDCTRDEAEAWTCELSQAIPWQKAEIALPPEPIFPKSPQFDSIALPREQTMVICAVPGPALNGEELAMCEILLQAENGLSSPIFKLVREENSLAYSTGMQLCGGFHPGYLMFYAVTSPENSRRALALLESELKRIAQKGLSKDVFNAAREGAAFAAAKSTQSCSATLLSALLSLHYGHSLDECLTHEKTLRNIRAEELFSHLKPYLTTPLTVQVIAGNLPKEELKS